MAEKSVPSQASIISVIREMVKSGESEQSIVKSLKELGIKERDAKKLLLLGEADTFALLQNEINKMVKEYFDREKPGLVKYIKEQIGAKEQEMVSRVEKRALGAFKEDQRFIENQATMFQARINQSVKNILQLNQETKQHISDLAGRVSNNERESWKLKEKVFGSKAIKFVSGLLMALEIGLVASTAYLVFTGAANTTIDVMVIAGTIGAILATIILLTRVKF